jgi:glycosyltransferase involved in cell wall biosynthesis
VRILVVHNYYQQKGGEDSVVEAEIALLAGHGHSVNLFQRHNDALNRMSVMDAAVRTVWAADAAHDFSNELTAFKPDVIHVHNTFPLISPSIYWVADRFHIPVVQTLHNFRLLCPQAMFLRDDKICEDCLGKIPWRAMTRRCYRESSLQSGLVAGMVTVHRGLGTWNDKVTRYIALNDFCRDKFIEGGLHSERIMVKPNFVDYDFPENQGRAGFLFVGRLSPEKGVNVLLDAANYLSETCVRIVGAGPEAEKVKRAKAVVSVGPLGERDVRQEMRQALALVLPSIWYENFPRTLVEAYASGLPVIASRLGALSELIKDGVTGLLFEPGNSSELAAKMAWSLQHPEEMAKMGVNARAHYEQYFTAERNYGQLIEIYQSAIDEVKSKVKG